MSVIETWPEFVRRVTGAMPQAKVAEVTGVAQTNIGRWLRGETDAPLASTVVAFARRLGESPLEALVAAGYISPEEAGATPVTQQGLRAYSTRQLLDELDRRIIDGDDGGLGG